MYNARQSWQYCSAAKGTTSKTLQQIEQELSNLPLADKLHLLQTLFFSLAHLWPAIEQTPGVVGGDACVMRTRIPVWALVQYRRLGWSDAQILENFPTLRQADLAQAWAYAAAYPTEIERALREQEAA
ncbi:MAG: DUF433 domain-containing protein [Caldilinea sp.]|uniref:DUF433 domain-containing protein n=1 Tax=Caldilinea sp. TaxID=2293560 RepID=UPI002BF8B665|nr:DUF433 domain-containing protein [Caldilinea sp.]